MLSRLGVVKWLVSDPHFDNITSTSNSSEGMFAPPVSEEKIQADVIISVCLIALLALHAHFCHLTKAVSIYVYIIPNQPRGCFILGRNINAYLFSEQYFVSKQTLFL